MKRLRRWLFNGLAALSLLMCVATVIVWIRSEFAYDAFWKISLDRTTGNWMAPAVIWDDGRLLVIVRTTHFNNPKGAGRPWTHTPAASYRHYPHGPQYNGFSNVKWMWFYQGDNWDGAGQRGREYWLILRIWIIAALFAIAPVMWAWRAKREHGRGTPGFCRQCGYDLRATPDRCPECGTIPRTTTAKRINTSHT